MEKRYYDAAQIARVLAVFEETFGISSSEFFEGHVSGEDPRVEDIPGHSRQTWAGFCRTYERMTHGGFAARAERELQHA